MGAFYLAVAVLFLLPLPLRLAETVVRVDSNDVWPHLWWMWWVREALQHGQNPYVTDRLFHPFGAPLHLAGMDLVTALLSIPIQGLLGLVASYNLLLILATTFGAYGMYLLALEETGSQEGAVVAGAVFGFSPLLSSVANQGQMESSNIGFLPLSILFLVRLDERGLGPPLFAALSLAGALLASFYQGLFLITFTALYATAEFARLALRSAWSPLRSLIGKLTGSWVLAFLLVSPALVPAARLGRANDLSQVPRDTIVMNSAGALDPFAPNALNPILATGAAGESCALGYVSLSLAVIGVCHARRRSLFWIAMILGFYALSLGPVLKLGRHLYEVPFLPYNMIRILPLGRIPRVPTRFLFLTLIAEAVLAAWGVAWLQEHLEIAARRVTRGLVVVACLTLVLSEWLPGPRAVVEARVPPFYSSLAGGSPGALLELPNSVISRAMYWQTAHGRPLVWGYVARHLEESLMTEALPVVRQLRIGTPEVWEELMSPDILEQASPLAQAAEVLDALGIRYVVLHKREEAVSASIPDFGLSRVLRQDTVVWDDDELQARLVPPRNARTEGVVLGLGQGWHRVERSADGTPYRWTAGTASLSLVLLDAQPRTVRLTAKAFSWVNPRVVKFQLGSRELGRVQLSTAAQRITLLLPLTPGSNFLYLQPDEPPGAAIDGRLLSVCLKRVHVEPDEITDGRVGAVNAPDELP